MAQQQVMVGLDVGTTKVCCLIGEVKGSREIQVVGVGIAPSRGLRKGLVVDMEEAAGAIASALKKAETFSGFQIMGAYVAVSGGHLGSELVQGRLDLGDGRQVSREDLTDVLESARPGDIEDDRHLLHLLPRGYEVDGENSIRNPLGMRASKLGIEGLVVTCGAAPLDNLESCVQRAGIKVDGFVCSGLASAESVLTETERQLGVLLVDLGGGTTDLVWFKDGDAQFAGAVPLGGYHVSNDISLGLGVPFAVAEVLKTRFASAVPASVPDDEMLGTGDEADGSPETVSRRFMSEIAEARISEILDLAAGELRRSGWDGVLPAGVVLTGGASQLRGIREVAQDVFKAPARVGSPGGVSGATDSIVTPPYATATGLLQWIAEQAIDPAMRRSMRQRVGLFGRLKGVVKAFVP